MLIVDQLKENIFELGEIYITNGVIVKKCESEDIILGEYGNHTSAKEVILDIIKAAKNNRYIFEMPEKVVIF